MSAERKVAYPYTCPLGSTYFSSYDEQYKLCKVKRVQLGAKGIPFLVTHDGRTIRYPDPLIKVNDTIKLDIESAKITEFLKFETGNLAFITGGHNVGRVGLITHRERHHGGFDIVHIKDALDRSFSTRISNVFVIGQGNKPWISLPKGGCTDCTWCWRFCAGRHSLLIFFPLHFCSATQARV